MAKAGIDNGVGVGGGVQDGFAAGVGGGVQVGFAVAAIIGVSMFDVTAVVGADVNCVGSEIRVGSVTVLV